MDKFLSPRQSKDTMSLKAWYDRILVRCFCDRSYGSTDRNSLMQAAGERLGSLELALASQYEEQQWGMAPAASLSAEKFPADYRQMFALWSTEGSGGGSSFNEFKKWWGLTILRQPPAAGKPAKGKPRNSKSQLAQKEEQKTRMLRALLTHWRAQDQKLLARLEPDENGDVNMLERASDVLAGLPEDAEDKKEAQQRLIDIVTKARELWSPQAGLGVLHKILLKLDGECHL